MCKAFSCIITRGKKVYWKLAIDSHEDIRDKFKLDTENKKRNTCAIEITPNNNNYVEPDKWDFKFDDDCPDWWKKSHEMACWSAHKEWYKQLRSKLHIKRLKNIIHPFKLPMVKKPTKKHIKLLKELAFVRGSVWGSVWAFVGDSVGDSVRDSVGGSVGDSVGDSMRDSVWGSVWVSMRYSVRDSVWDSVWGSVGASVRDSVWDSVWGYTSSFFNIPKWKYVKHEKGKNPFQSGIDLWERGLVPNFDGNIWRLNGGKKGKVLFEIAKKDLGMCKKCTELKES